MNLANKIAAAEKKAAELREALRIQEQQLKVLKARRNECAHLFRPSLFGEAQEQYCAHCGVSKSYANANKIITDFLSKSEK